MLVSTMHSQHRHCQAMLRMPLAGCLPGGCGWLAAGWLAGALAADLTYEYMQLVVLSAVGRPSAYTRSTCSTNAVYDLLVGPSSTSS